MPIANLRKAHIDMKEQTEKEIDEIEGAIKLF
jgi:hypothetical protein